MRDILATLQPVLHVPLGLAASIIAMTSSVVIALSSPYQPPKAQWMIIAALPASAAESVATGSTREAHAVVADLAPVKEELPDEIEPLAPRAPAPSIDAVADAKAYLAATAYAGGTMTMLGREKSVECFHPQFALNLAATLRDARQQGFPEAGVLSGCRPPRLGIGGFKDKKNSLHGVGLAADINGIGSPCSDKAKRFHTIAASHGVAGVYGPCNSAEWNHMQGAEIKMTTPALRATFTPRGDIDPDLKQMWKAESDVVLAVDKPVGAPVSTVGRASHEKGDADAHHRERRHRRTRRIHRHDDDDDDS